MNRIAVCTLLIGIICAVPATASAVQVLPVNLEELVEKAGLIFEGTCMSVDSRPDEQGIIATYTTFNVHQTWKGEVSTTITIKTYGGRYGSLKMTVPGMPAFKPGEQVFLFLHPTSEIGFTSPIGMGQGRFKIFINPDGGKKLVNDDNNRHLFRNLDWEHMEGSADRNSISQLRMSREPSAGPVGYDVLKHLVEVLLQRSGGRIGRSLP
ncbi:MAG: hypothetical protein JRI22_03385 [Deltaproteobacteria bacterium]|nr:hypothetical protein [Deltaproteobacteria bacterium]